MLHNFGSQIVSFKNRQATKLRFMRLMETERERVKEREGVSTATIAKDFQVQNGAQQSSKTGFKRGTKTCSKSLKKPSGVQLLYASITITGNTNKNNVPPSAFPAPFLHPNFSGIKPELRKKKYFFDEEKVWQVDVLWGRTLDPKDAGIMWYRSHVK